MRLGEAHIAQRAHHAGAGERLGQEQRLGVLLGDRRDHVLPEAHRLGVRIVDAENGHACGDPQVHDALDFLFDAGHVGVEVDGVDVLILLRRVLGEGDGAVRLGAEPIRMLPDPRVIGGALQGEVERDLKTELVCAGAERLEIVHGAQQRVDGVMAAKLGADAERGARIVRACDQRIVASLAIGHTDGENRWQIHDVEPFGGRTFQAGQRGLEIALHDFAVFAVVGAFRTWEELVPCGEAGLRTFHAEPLRIRFGQAVS